MAAQSTMTAQPAATTQTVAARVMNMLDLATEISCWLTLPEASLAKGISNLWNGILAPRIQQAIDPKAHVGRYFDDWMSFIKLMANRDILVAGVPILDILDERRIDPSTRCLEILVEAPMGPDVMSFASAEGYLDYAHAATRSVLPDGFVMPPPYFIRPTYRTYAARFVESVVRMVRPANDPKDCRILDVVYTTYGPSVTIARSEDTVRMTFMSWNKIYCLFPIGTLLQRRGLYVSHAAGRFRPGPCEATGYVLGTSLDAARTDDPDTEDWGPFGPQLRWFGDERTFVIDLPLPPMPGIAVSPYNIAMNSFELSLTSMDGPSRHTPRGVIYLPKMTSVPLADPGLGGWSFSAFPEFWLRASKHMRDRAQVHGLYWRYDKTTPAMVDTLPSLREAYMIGGGGSGDDGNSDEDNDNSDNDSMPPLLGEEANRIHWLLSEMEMNIE